MVEITNRMTKWMNPLAFRYFAVLNRLISLNNLKSLKVQLILNSLNIAAIDALNSIKLKKDQWQMSRYLIKMLQQKFPVVFGFS
jgi:hypothetical protein